MSKLVYRGKPIKCDHQSVMHIMKREKDGGIDVLETINGW
jgi:hypothetical protein